jgi:hypothetical protein
MKVKELVEMLLREDQEAEIGFSYNYGDYGRSEVVSEIEEIDTKSMILKVLSTLQVNKIIEESEDEDREISKMVVIS